MAKKSNIGMMERAGYALGQSNVSPSNRGFSEAFKKSFKIKVEEKKAKSDEMLKQFPNGISISKVPESFRPQLTGWLSDNKTAFANAATIIAKGREADPNAYDDAIETQNNIEAAYLNMSKSLESVATIRQGVSNRARATEQGGQLKDENGNVIANPNALSMTDNDQHNFDNIFQENWGTEGGLNAQIVDNKLMFTNATGDQVDANDFGGFVGTEYDYATENVIDNLTTGIEDLAVSKNPYWNRKATKRKLEEIARDPQAVKNYMMQNTELMDEIISAQSGIPTKINGKDNPDWIKFKQEGKTVDTPNLYSLAQGNLQLQESTISYDDFFDKNKVDVDFTNGFVDTVMNTLEKSYANATASYLQYQQKVAEETSEETTGGEFDNLIE